MGDQSLAGQNLRLAQHRDTATAVHLFEVFRQNQYEYRGQVELCGPVSEGRQIDDVGTERRVLIFPLRLLNEAIATLPGAVDISGLAHERQRSLRRKSLNELADLAAAGARDAPGRRNVITVQYQRNDAITVLVKRLANGTCDLCDQPAPFQTSEGPYLECHHLKRLADGGPDTMQNVVALCPNCHRRMHLAATSSDERKLLGRIQSRQLALTRNRARDS